MSNPTVSFRISDYHLARGLRAIRILEPNWRLTTTSELIRTIFNDYIAKAEFQNKTPLNVPPELLQEIAFCRAGLSKNQDSQSDILPQLGQTKQQSQNHTQKPVWQIQEDLENEKLLQQLKQESREKQEQEQSESLKTLKAQQTAEQIKLSSQAENRTRIKPSEFHDPNITESVISSVTDFSPPKEWKE